jgi:hypothetical protein
MRGEGREGRSFLATIKGTVSLGKKWKKLEDKKVSLGKHFQKTCDVVIDSL